MQEVSDIEGLCGDDPRVLGKNPEKSGEKKNSQSWLVLITPTLLILMNMFADTLLGR